MAGTETITLRLVAVDLLSGNVTKAIGSIDKLARRGGIVGSVLQGVGQSMGQMLNPAGMVADAIGAVTSALGDSVQAYREDQLSQEKLRASLEANITAWDGNTDAIEAVIKARMDLAFSDDEQRDSLASIVASIKDVNDALALQRTAMDLARLRNVSLADASEVLTKAYNGATTGLRKMGFQIRTGARGLEALEEVTKAAAGQAETFADTSTGAMQRLGLKVGELQESFGSLIEGPLTGFVGFLTDIVDAIDGNDGATAAIDDITQALYGLKGGVDAIAGSSVIDKVQARMEDWSLALKLLGTDLAYSGEEAQQAIEWMTSLGPDTLGNFGPATDAMRDSLMDMAMGVVYTGGTFEDFARLVREALGRRIPGGFNILTSTWGTTVESVKRDAASLYGGVVQPVKHAFRDVFATMAEQKEPWITAWKNIARWAKDPFRPDAFERWLGRRADKAIEKAKQAARDGRPEVAKRWAALASVMRKPVLAALADTEADIQALVDALLIVQGVGRRTGTTRMGSQEKVAGRAHGGPVSAGRTYLVGEDGPELLTMGSQGGRITPNHRLGGGTVVVNVTHIGSLSEAEGDRLAAVIEKPLRRRMARAGG